MAVYATCWRCKTGIMYVQTFDLRYYASRNCHYRMFNNVLFMCYLSFNWSFVELFCDVQAHRPTPRLDVWSVDSTWLQPIDCWTVDVWLRRRDGSDVFSLMCRVLIEFLDARVICKKKQIIVFYLCFERHVLHICTNYYHCFCLIPDFGE